MSGLSPHSRGKLTDDPPPIPDVRSIPAFTGEICCDTLKDVYFEVYPRIHGGNSEVKGNKIYSTGLSPHSRGKRRTLAGHG